MISRYSRIAGYDWIAIPLVPYLYAVERPEDVPVSADAASVAALRDHYRRQHLEDLVPDGPHGEPPGGAWGELIGAAYNRKIYGFQIETAEGQDDRLISELNSRKNRSHFNLFFNNCADFSRRILNLYYPGSVHRSYVADVGITTPKQLASSLAGYGKRHLHLMIAAFFIPQVPGSKPPSHKMRGVCEAFIESKKYVLPFAGLHPWIATGMVVAYVITGRFNVAHYAETRYEPAELPQLWDEPASPGHPIEFSFDVTPSPGRIYVGVRGVARSEEYVCQSQDGSGSEGQCSKHE